MKNIFPLILIVLLLTSCMPEPIWKDEPGIYTKQVTIRPDGVYSRFVDTCGNIVGYGTFARRLNPRYNNP